jgi:prefoldin subunit 5
MKTVRGIEFIYDKIRELEEEICSNETQIDLLQAHIAELTNDSEEISRTLDDLRSVL